MPSRNYKMFARAIATRTPVACRYDGFVREVCPIILGHSDGREKALVWQFGGETSGGPLRGAKWKCFDLSKVEGAAEAAGAWQAGISHQQAQSCVKEVDYDANPASPYSPTRSLGDLRSDALDRS
jgi:hypothetical protein